MKKQNDEGAALVLVLVVVTVIALSLTALLTRTDASIRTTVGLRDQVAATYDADGAMQAAINNLRNSSYSDSPGQHCFGSSNTLQLNGFYGADSAAVTCSADPKKVLIQCPSLSQCNRPGNAILTLGKVSGEDGLHIDQPTGSTFRVRGNIFSNSNINVDNGTLQTNARVTARTSCSGAIQSTPPPACNYGTTPNALGNDPDYSPAVGSVPARRSLPACTTPGSVVTFLPGYYDDAVGLSEMMKGNSACRNSTWWFKPGTYYFDFHNTDNPLLPSGKNVWTVDDGHLVAGNPVDSSGNALAAPPVPANIPGSCSNPIKNASAVGVQFIFGGDSRFEVKSGEAEICGTYSVNKPPVAIYGLKSGSATSTTSTLQMTSVVATDKFVGTGGGTAAWVKSSSNNQTGSVTFGGYQNTMPAGSILTSAKLRVIHSNTAGSTADNLEVRISPAGGSPITRTIPSYADNATHTEVIDVWENGTGSLAQLVNAGTYSDAQIRYQANLRHQGIERLDGIQLELTYMPPAFRASSGCVTGTPYTGVGNDSTCALIRTVNNDGNQFYVQGTTYVPKAVVDLTLNNAAEQVFRFGVVARSVWVKETGSFSYTGVVIEVPDDSPGFVFSMYLAAYLCPNSATCTPSGAPALRARVALVDDDPVTPVPGARQVTVLSWTRPG